LGFLKSPCGGFRGLDNTQLPNSIILLPDDSQDYWDNQIYSWQSRDITTIEKCKTCDVALACGGGCASVAKNKFGHPNNPDCRPVKELLSLGAAYYLAP
jgi:radical SAM protein with 4Fe4S-binding SPASM domain